MEQAPQRPDFGAILESALALPSKEQARLCLVLQKVAGAHLPTQSVVTTGAAAAQQPPTHDQWLLSIQQETGWQQLQLLDDALAQAAGEDEMRALELARERLLHDQPALAVRGAVVDLATRHPMGVLLGCAGLCVALAALVRFLFAALF